MNKVAMFVPIAWAALSVVGFAKGEEARREGGREREVEAVKVVNSPSRPVPTQAQGTTTVAGDVNATLVGTPTVNVGALPSVTGSVTLDNTATHPVIVQKRDEPARQPFQHEAFFEITSPGFGNSDTFQVPSNKQLVLEYASFSSNIATGANQIVAFSITNTGGGQPGLFRFLPQASINSAVNSTSFIAERLVRIYCDQNTSVTVGVIRNTSNGSDAVGYTLSGYLVDVP
jgi:hypothetical protein